MADREKVVSLIEDAIEIVEKEAYWTVANGLRDAFAMLKEHEAKTVIKIAKRFNDCDLTGYCPFCSRPLIKDWAENYCGYCGKPVLWEGR